jgi:arabinose-5-phosphate isomerase
MEGLLEYRAGEVMTPNPSTIQPLALAEEALSQMNARKITCLFVLDPAQAVGPVGVLHIHDCLRAGLG